MLRKAVPITPVDLAAVEDARSSGVLAEFLGSEVSRSEAAALSAILRLGLERLSEFVAERGYAALAVAQDDEDRAYAAAIRSRRRSAAE